ncbi:phosphoribosylaminoimidazolesuccinocarboxamide synthase [Methylobacterium sp. J-030]|uniref:phosphoribosylaminoimidazolesuccinocarboxamide synthase n=1 Tax=Methylobacterium sp. J-030 TaxID=2836627 RepID=UPI001FB9F1FE|nr:phosphoribosylaminoimidazolesuccinocarboxamide synthase [Methylobacterium sp. J-030]MCJ2071730.1 phosphoribosylaminoimidazolesuccinocarboxamide synthase [Methylobacterium sp. J-030]
MNTADLAPHAHQVLAEATLSGLPDHYRGKVRDNYDLPDGRRILITTDRISAFDRALAAIPFKGRVLTQTARFWFEQTVDLCPNHVLAYPDPNVVVGRRLEILPVEVVVRGYLAGTTSTSVLTRYRAGEREMYGHRFPDGMRPNEQLPVPIITPTTKAFDGGHDEPLTETEILARGLLSAEQWRVVSDAALALFARGQAVAAERGLILADTKYEFGTDAEGRIVLADEIHTPDSSRYWFAQSYADRFGRGAAPESFDKDFVRNWVVARCDPYREPIPEIPADVVLETAAVYIRAYEIITGARFVLPDPSEVPLDRVRRNLDAYLAANPDR